MVTFVYDFYFFFLITSRLWKRAPRFLSQVRGNKRSGRAEKHALPQNRRVRWIRLVLLLCMIFFSCLICLEYLKMQTFLFVSCHNLPKLISLDFTALWLWKKKRWNVDVVYTLCKSKKMVVNIQVHIVVCC